VVELLRKVSQWLRRRRFKAKEGILILLRDDAGELCFQGNQVQSLHFMRWGLVYNLAKDPIRWRWHFNHIYIDYDLIQSIYRMEYSGFSNSYNSINLWRCQLPTPKGVGL
jgi:hypothetical protein